MRPAYLWLATFLLLPVAGAPLLAHRAFGSLSRPCRAALSAAVGAVLVSLLMTLSALVSIPWSVPGLAVAAAAAAALLRLALKADPDGGTGSAPRAR